MKKNVFLFLFLFSAVWANAATISGPNVLMDKRTYDSSFFQKDSTLFINSFVEVGYGQTSQNRFTNEAVIHSSALEPHYGTTSLSMFYDFSRTQTDIGFFRYLVGTDPNSDASWLLRDMEGTYDFSVAGEPSTSVSLTVPTFAFDQNFGFVDPTVVNGLASWDAVDGAEMYRVRLYSLLANGNIGTEIGNSGNILDTQYDLASINGWDTTRDLVLAIEARDYMFSAENSYFLANRTRYYTVVEAASVPEPATILLLGGGLVGLWFGRKKIQK